MEEPDVWGTLTARDSVIFHDNDFEVFIDPDGDTHAYYELEVNALGTPWDLMLIKPYRDGGPAINGWDIAGLARRRRRARHASTVRAIATTGGPSSSRCPGRSCAKQRPRRQAPRSGERWRVNFSRVAVAGRRHGRRYT